MKTNSKLSVKPSRSEKWQSVLDAEIKRWSTKSYAELVAELLELQTYEIGFQHDKYQVEVQILENVDKYVHVLVSVDDGSIPASFHPLSSSFIREK